MFLNIKYALDKDITNYKIIATVKHKGGTSKVLELFKKRFGDDMTEENCKKFINGLIDYNKIDINNILNNVCEDWQMIETEFISRANKLFGYNLSPRSITAFLTTNDRSAYSISDNYFFVSVLSKSPMRIIMHELLHFYTEYTFGAELKKLDEKSAYDIKESLIELLNLEFADLLDAPDISYPQHQEMRASVRKNWEEKNDLQQIFRVLVELTISSNK